MAENIIWLPLSLGILIFSCIIHECAHGLVAYWLGDPTAYRQGRITLNPIPHIDLKMTLIFPLILYIITALSGRPLIFGGAKPVPINPYNFKNPEKDDLWATLAGPFSNVILTFIAFSFLYVFAMIISSGVITDAILIKMGIRFLSLAITINLMLALFNLIPIPPLDGSWVLQYFLSWRMKETFERIRPFGMFILIAVLLSGGLDFLSVILYKFESFLFSLLPL